ncbi:MAG: hypothetical protein K6E20_05545 [Acholeplasmatales bacterium]|nr:hypothetical protein [Acholeplasmatales bacterium]
MKDKKKKNLSKTRVCREVLFWFIRIVCIVLILYSIVRFATDSSKGFGSKYISFILQAGLMFIFTFVEIVWRKLFKATLPNIIQITFLLFCTCAILLGEIADFYVRFSWWDDVLHVFSGGFVCELGVLLILYLNETYQIPVKLSPLFVVVFAFLLSMTIAAVWEMFEYGVDKLFDSNMQRAYESVSHNEYGKINDPSDPHFNALVGTDALNDTMGDIIEGFIGSILVCIFTFWDYKRDEKKNKLEALKKEEESKTTNIHIEPDEIKQIEIEKMNDEIVSNSEKIRSDKEE